MRLLLFFLLAAAKAGAQILAIGASKMNICYIGVDNPLSAAFTGCREGKLGLRTDNGFLSDAGNGHFIYRPERPGPTRLVAYCARSRDTVRVGDVPFRIRELPTPRPAVSGIYGGPIRKSLLLAAAGMEAKSESFDFDGGFAVTSFEFSTRSADGSLSGLVSAGSASFSPEMKTAMRSLKPGDRVYLDNILCRGPDGTTRNLSSLILIVD